MKWLARIVASLAVGVIVITVMAYVTDQTLWNANYLTIKLEQGGIDKVFAESILSAAPVDSQPDLKTVVNQGYVDRKLANYFDQLEIYYRRQGAAPRIEFPELEARGLPAGVAQQLSQIPLSQPAFGATMQNTYDWVKKIKLWGPIVALLLLALAWLCNHGARRHGAIAKVFFSVAVSLGASYVVFLGLPGVLGFLIPKDTDKNVAEVMHSLLKLLLGGVASGIGRAAIGFAIAALVIAVVDLILKGAGHFGGRGGGANDRLREKFHPPE